MVVVGGRSKGTRSHGADAAVAVLVVVDDLPARRLLIDALTATEGITLAAEVGEPADAAAVAEAAAPDAVLMDVELPGLDGVRAAHRLTLERPGLPVVLLAEAPSDELSMLALRAGAVGAVPAGIAADALARVLRAVVLDEAVVPHHTARAMSEEVHRLRLRARELRPIDSCLTTREWQVLHLMSAGVTTAAIARELFLSVHTVRSHVKRMLAKLEVHSRAEAIAWAARVAGAADDPPPVARDEAEEERSLGDELARLLQDAPATRR